MLKIVPRSNGLFGVVLAITAVLSGCDCKGLFVRQRAPCDGRCDARHQVCNTKVDPEVCVNVPRVCNNDADCCPSQKCNTQGVCLDKYTTCTADSTCTASGQFCTPLGVDPAGQGCTFKSCDATTPCADNDACFNGFCVGEAPCQGGCRNGTVCVTASNLCFPLDNDRTKWPTGCEQTCQTGFMLVLQNPHNVFDSCDMSLRQCSCVELPPLRLGDDARHSSLAVSEQTLWVSAYDGTYGDLVVHRLDKKTGAIANTDFVDGVPATGTVVGAPSGPRHGISDPGVDVGKFTDIAIDQSGRVEVSYYDITNGDLKFAIRDGNGAWITYVLDGSSPAGIDNGDVGLYTSLALASDGSPAIAYFQRSGAGGNRHTALKYIRATKPAPLTRFDWYPSIEVDGADRSSPACGGACADPANQACVTLTDGNSSCQRIDPTGCSPKCGGGQACVDVNGLATCLTSQKVATIADLPLGVGLMPSLAFIDASPVIAYYANLGSLVQGTNWGPDTLRLALGSGSVAQPAFLVSVLDGGTTTSHSGLFPSVAISGNSGGGARINIAFQEVRRNRLKLYRGDGISAVSTNNTSVVDEGFADPNGDALSFVGANASLVIGADGGLGIAYQNQTAGKLKYARAAASGKFTLTTVPRVGATGFYAKLRLHGAEAWISHAKIKARSVSEADNSLYVESVQVP